MRDFNSVFDYLNLEICWNDLDVKRSITAYAYATLYD